MVWLYWLSGGSGSLGSGLKRWCEELLAGKTSLRYVDRWDFLWGCVIAQHRFWLINLIFSQQHCYQTTSLTVFIFQS